VSTHHVRALHGDLVLELTWIGSSSASALHLTDMVRRGHEPMDGRFDEAVGAGQDLWETLGILGTGRERVWAHMLGLCATVENNRELCQIAYRKAIGGENSSALAQLTGAVTRVEDTLRKAIPDLADQLVQRMQPLLTVWKTRGPGLFHQVSKMVEPGVLTDQAQVVGVLPIVGGSARALLNYNHVHIEAVLADGDPTLPEVLRLAWCLLQLNVDLPRYSESIHGDRLSLIAGLVLVPITLAVGEMVELVKVDDSTVAHAIATWCSDLDAPENSVELVQDWWVTYLESRPPWNVAVTAMERMLFPG
jgi:hypothetical protein